jgi:hypothetical protein
VNPKPHFDHLETAFLQLSFSLKLWHFLHEHPFNKDDFDIDLTTGVAEDWAILSSNEFKSYDDIILAAENNISITWGIAALTLWEAIRECNHLEAKDLRPLSSRKHSIASLVYMIRCCFAHGSARPTWCIKPKFRLQYKVGNKSIDLSNVENGKPFDWQDVGGRETLWHIKGEALCIGLL